MLLRHFFGVVAEFLNGVAALNFGVEGREKLQTLLTLPTGRVPRPHRSRCSQDAAALEGPHSKLPNRLPLGARWSLGAEIQTRSL